MQCLKLYLHDFSSAPTHHNEIIDIATLSTLKYLFDTSGNSYVSQALQSLIVDMSPSGRNPPCSTTLLSVHSSHLQVLFL